MRYKSTPWVVKPLVADEIYVDREEFLDYFYEDAHRSVTRRGMSTVLLGRRRMGKTEIFKRVVNRLFFEQDPTNPETRDSLVVPIYYSFPDVALERWLFAERYIENFMRHYVGFYTRQPDLIIERIDGDDLLHVIEEARSLYPFTKTLDWMLRWHKSIRTRDATDPLQTATEAIRTVSDVDDTTIAVFLDEFQNTRLPQFEFDIVGYMKEAVESPTCPHYVTGSAMSILSREIIGRGALFGRFRSQPIKELSAYWGAELARKSADYHKVELTQLMAPIVAERCGGNPFYINAVIKQAAVLQTPLLDEDIINNALSVDITSGFIWTELYEQVTTWIERTNDYGITKWILYLSAIEEEERISLERIQRELLARDGQDVSLEKIRDVLVKLSRGDLLEYLELGQWFRKIDDPILLEFLKVWGRIDVEGQNPVRVQRDLVTRYGKLKRRIYEYQGYLAEVFMSQVLLSSQDIRKQPIPGSFFNSSEDVKMRRPLIYVHQRVRLNAGKGQEIDVLGAIGDEMWVCQSKWITTKKIGVDVLKELIGQAKGVEAEYDTNGIHMWLFAHEGLTKEAEKLARKEGILWSDRAQLDDLLEYLNLRKLPILS